MKPKYHTGRRHAGRNIKMDAIRTFHGAECSYDLAPGDDGRWYLIYEMIDPPTWAMSWPSLEAARRFLDPMSVEEGEQIEHVILLVVDKTGQVIVSDLGEANSVQGFLQDLDKVAAEAIAGVVCTDHLCADHWRQTGQIFQPNEEARAKG